MKIQATELDAYRLQHHGVLALARAERAGIRCDVDYIETQQKLLSRKIERLEGKVKDSKFYKDWERSSTRRINMYSDTQLRTFLYVVKKLKQSKATTSGKGSTDEETLTALNIPELNILIQIRKLQKIRDTYLGGFLREQVNGFIHPSYNLHLVRTFRSSADRPNLQNIPIRDKESMRITRRALFPRKGNQLLEIDFGQLEVRIAASYNQDPKLIHDIIKGDMHADMAMQLFLLDDYKPEHNILRAAAKNSFVFPQFYGDYFKNCAEALVGNKWGKLPTGRWKADQGIPIPGGTLGGHLISKGIRSLDNFIDHVEEIENDFWGNRYKQYARWKKQWWHQYQKTGFIKMKTGFVCSGIMNRKECINYPVQGAAFHCNLWALIEIDKELSRLKFKTRIIGQVHDSIILDIFPPELSEVLILAKKITCEELPKAWDWINVPLTIDAELCGVDESWADKKKIEMA